MVEEETQLKELISSAEIKERLLQVSRVLDEKYYGEELVILMIMKGAVCLAADLIRTLNMKLSIDYIRCSSYEGQERGDLTIIGEEYLDLENKNVLVVDDIFDSGVTMDSVVKKLKLKNPKRMESLVLLNKLIEKSTEYRPDYTLFDVEDLFVVGYGLDYNENYRELPGIYVFKNSPE